VKNIRYADRNNKWKSVSQALASGDITDSRLHVEYANGLNLFFNWSLDENWTVPKEKDTAVCGGAVLPPGGLCIFDKEGFFEASRMKDGHRMDEVVSPDYIYLDGRDKPTSNGYISAKGGAALRYKKGGAAEIIDIGGNDEVGFKAKKKPSDCAVFDSAGKSLGKAKLRFEGGYVYIKFVNGARSYVVK
jgi:hypothetical protein